MLSQSDIVVDSLQPLESDPFQAEEDIDFNFRVVNFGSVDTGSFYVGIVIDSTLMGTLYISNQPAYTYTPVTLTIQETPEGFHTIQVVGDYYSNVQESNETNNTDAGTYEWRGVPNLTTTSLSLQESPPHDAGQLLQYTLLVQNTGTGKASGTSEVVVSIDGQATLGWQITDFPAHTYANLTFNLIFIQAGDYLLEAEIDPDNMITELNEGDNTISQLYTIRISPQITVKGYLKPDLKFSHLSTASASETPLEGFNVKVMDQDGSTLIEKGSDITDANGYFECTVSNEPDENGLDLFICLELNDSIVRIQPHGLFASPYKWYSTGYGDIHT